MWGEGSERPGRSPVDRWISSLFDTADFAPRWLCGHWTSLHGWTHIVSDALIFGAYFAIPAVLLYLVRRRADIPFPRVFWLFGAFIVLCGATHLIECFIFWKPIYRVSALVKVLTAIASWATVAALIPLIPRVLKYRSPESIRIEDELRRSNEELEQFAYVASHDLKAPLRAIHQLATWIADEIDGKADGEAIQHLALLRGRTERMHLLLDGLLAYSRATRIPFEVRHVDTRELVDEARLLIESFSEGFQVEIAGDLPRFPTHVTPLDQVFTNLLGNAAKHHDRSSGRATVSCRDAGDFWEFCVADDGPGIDPRYHERIFNVFQTLKPRDEAESTGIGLAIVSKIVTSYGGRVWVDSAEGRGARFFFTWPKHVAGDRVEEATAQLVAP